MRHLKRKKIFGRERNQRHALMKGLASSFFMLGKIKTTEAKARALRPFAEKALTCAKNPTLARTRALQRIFSPRVTKKIVAHAKEFSARTGGYTRITKFGTRLSDSARMAIIELVK